MRPCLALLLLLLLALTACRGEPTTAPTTRAPGDDAAAQATASMPGALWCGDECLGGVAQLVSAGARSCARLDTGAVACWGASPEGAPPRWLELGDARAVDVALDATRACIVTEAGTVRCADARAFDAPLGPLLAPPVLAGVSDAVDLELGSDFGCLRRATGAVACWGSARFGQLGEHAGEGLVELEGLEDAQALAIGDGGRHACALRADATVACWGENTFGQLGDGTRAHRTVPVAVAGVGDVIGLAASATHTCARHRDGRVACWGRSTAFAPAPEAPTLATSPRELDVAGTRALAAGQHRTCVVTAAGTVRCGADEVEGLVEAKALSVGAHHACALAGAARQVLCWGRNDLAQLGVDLGEVASSLAVLDGVVDLDAEFQGVCAVRRDGSLWCWGDGVARPQRVLESLDDVERVCLGQSHRCLARRDGTVWCWGANDFGQLDQPEAVAQLEAPVQIAGLGATTRLDCGTRSTCAIHDGGKLTCWGENRSGQIGDGAQSWRARTTQPEPAIDVDTGYATTCAVEPDGAVQCWGDVGPRDGPIEPYGTYARVRIADAAAQAISCAPCCMLREAGRVACFDPAERSSWSPASALSERDLTGARAVHEGCTVDEHGRVLCEDVAATLEVRDAVQLARGYGFLCARTAAGEVRCAGDSEHGATGTGIAEQTSRVPFALGPPQPPLVLDEAEDGDEDADGLE